MSVVNVHSQTDEINGAVARHLLENPPTIELPTHTVERIEVQLQPVQVPHTHDKELPEGAEDGQVLTQVAGSPQWEHPHSESEHLYAAMSVLSDEIEAIKEELRMSNEEKIRLQNKLSDYWKTKHPDCFLVHGDGRNIFQPDLLTFKMEGMLTDLYNREPPVKEIKTVVIQHKQVSWPFWAALAALALAEIVHVVL